MQYTSNKTKQQQQLKKMKIKLDLYKKTRIKTPIDMPQREKKIKEMKIVQKGMTFAHNFGYS